jgi:membrane associated rhomboid family serine protease
MSPVVRALLILLAAAFIVQMTLSRFGGLHIERLLGFAPVDFFGGQVWQILTYTLLHGSLTHLLFNLFILYMLGTELEWRWGSKKFLRYYVLCALGGAFLHTLIWLGLWIFDSGAAQSLGRVPIIGASGALYGLFVAFGILYAESPVLVFFVLPMKAKQFVVLLTLIEIVSAVFFSNTGVAHLVHLGGMLTGYLLIKLQGPNLSGGGGLGSFLKRRQRMSRDEVRSRLRVIRNDEKGDKGFPITWN